MTSDGPQTIGSRKAGDSLEAVKKKSSAVTALRLLRLAYPLVKTSGDVAALTHLEAAIRSLEPDEAR